MKSYLQDIRNVVCDAGLEAEEREAVIAPGSQFNHNETFLAAPGPLKAAELEPVIAQAGLIPVSRGRTSRRDIMGAIAGVGAVAGLAVGTAGPASAQGGLVYASWVHGTIVQSENPNALVVRRGWGSDCSGLAGGPNWFHFPVPTPVILQDVRNKVVEVFVLYKASHAYVTDIHLWDSTNIIRFTGLNFAGDHFAGVDPFNSWVLPLPWVMRFGLVISVGVNFASDPDNPGVPEVLFTSAGADFQRA